MKEDPLRQLFYHSLAVGRPDIAGVLASSKRNNGMDGITGVLFFDGRAYLQVLEGAHGSVSETYARICQDPRHTDIAIISDHVIEKREFLYWDAEVREPGQPSDEATSRLQRRLEQFAPELRSFFFSSQTNDET